MTFAEFSAYWRDQEARFGTRMVAYHFGDISLIGARGPLTEEELRIMYDHQQSELATGVAHHGTIIAGPNVLDFKVV